MTEKRFTYEYDEYNGNLFDNKMNTFYHIEDSDENIELLCNQLNDIVNENKQLKTTISNLIEQNRKNNDLLISDIRLLEKALWCKQCAIDIKRLKELRKEFEK